MIMEHWRNDTDRVQMKYLEKNQFHRCFIHHLSHMLRSGRSRDRIPVERDFLHPSTPALGPTQSPIQWVPGLFPGGRVTGAGIDHPHLAPRLRKEWSCTSTPLWAFVVCSRVTFTFYLYLVPHGVPGSVFGVATDYGLDDPAIESRWGARFSAPVQTGPGTHSASCTIGTGSFPGVKSGRGVTLTPHPF